MGLKERSYPAALAAGPAAGDAGVRTGLEWVVAMRRRLGGQILVYAPQKAQVERHELLRSFMRHSAVVVGTWRRPVIGWEGGPVLAAWPDSAKLGEIADDPRTTALCVVPWVKGEVDAWVEAVGPELLAGAEAPKADGDPLDPVVIEALKTLTSLVNHGNNLAGPLDRRDAVAVFRTLREAGYRWNSSQVYSWALKHNWPARGADRLHELAKDFEDGKRPQLKGGNPLKPDIVEQWRTQASSQ